MRIIVSVLICMMIFTMISEAEIQLEFNCQGKNEATVMTYSYVQDSYLEESGYTRGLKTGSFNYLEEGNIDFDEGFYYDFGNGTTGANSSLEHWNTLNFSGKRGISEFYAKGYFLDNRAISSWKKIRYENVSKEYKNLSKDYEADEINVDAYVVMDTKAGVTEGPYELEYVANMTDAVFESGDTAGWSNKTSATKVDVEHTTLMRGDLNVTNDFKDTTVVFPGAGAYKDWLSCCIGGGDQLQKEIANETEKPDWPNAGTFYTLEPQILTHSNLTNCTPSIDNCCPGLGCISCYPPPEQFGTTVHRNVYTVEEPTVAMDIEHWYTFAKVAERTTVLYEIDITSKSEEDIIKDVRLVDKLPAKMQLVTILLAVEKPDGSYTCDGSDINLTKGKLGEEIEEFEYKFGDFQPFESKTLYVKLSHANNVSPAIKYQENRITEAEGFVNSEPVYGKVLTTDAQEDEYIDEDLSDIESGGCEI